MQAVLRRVVSPSGHPIVGGNVAQRGVPSITRFTVGHDPWALSRACRTFLTKNESCGEECSPRIAAGCE